MSFSATYQEDRARSAANEVRGCLEKILLTFLVFLTGDVHDHLGVLGEAERAPSDPSAGGIWESQALASPPALDHCDSVWRDRKRTYRRILHRICDGVEMRREVSSCPSIYSLRHS